jgi:glycosyltransferase involved in cell wall biosynthesis
MRIAIFNRWLHTLGGGERETGAFAQVLQAEHRVELLTHQAADLALFARRLNLRLPDVRLRTLPFDPDHAAVAAASADYDLFVNMSHGDLFVPRARHNLLRVFFPTRAAAPDDASSTGDLSAPAGLPQPILIHGFYPPEHDATRSFAWTGAGAQALVTLAPTRWLAGTARELRLTLHGWRPPGASPAVVKVWIDGAPLGSRELRVDGSWDEWRVSLPRNLGGGSARISIATTTFNPSQLGLSDDPRTLGVALAAIRVVQGPLDARRADRNGRGAIDQAAYSAMMRRQAQSSVGAYDRLLANSRYTADWISRRWALRSQVLYPPVDTTSFTPQTKQPFILSVGRFFAGAHNKKHLQMIEAFRAMVDAGLRGWEYHLAGGCDESMPEQRAYLARVRAAAAGYPIVIHANLPFAELRALYGAASIFWHATGLGEDEATNPESFEHFGISTVEAMAAGCVPVVIGKAGQIEIVDDGRSGFLWQTLPELQARTAGLIADPELLTRMSQAARQRSHAFETTRFEREVRALVAEYDSVA